MDRNAASEFETCVIRNAGHEDLAAIVRIHKQAYSRSHLTALLPDQLLASYYASFLSGGNEIVVVQLGALQGMAGGTEGLAGFAVFGERISAGIAEFRSRFKWQLFASLTQHPVHASRKLLTRLSSRFVNHKFIASSAPFLLLSIAVMPGRKGLGSRLIEEMKVKARARGHVVVGLFVNIEDIAAVNAYNRAGFRIVRYGDRQYYMECQLDNR